MPPTSGWLSSDGGRQWGLSLRHAVQPRPQGIAQAFLIGREFIGNDGCMLVLGDNLFHGHGLTEILREVGSRREGATIFCYQVRNPGRYGVVTFDARGRAISVEEKPDRPCSPWAVTGLYCYDNDIVRIAADLTPSTRGELEITDANARYLERGDLHVKRLGRGFAWFDTGTHDSLVDAASFVQTVEKRQNQRIAIPEEIAFRNGWIGRDALAVARPSPAEEPLRRVSAEAGGRGTAGLAPTRPDRRHATARQPPGSTIATGALLPSIRETASGNGARPRGSVAQGKIQRGCSSDRRGMLGAPSGASLPGAPYPSQPRTSMQEATFENLAQPRTSRALETSSRAAGSRIRSGVARGDRAGG